MKSRSLLGRPPLECGAHVFSSEFFEWVAPCWQVMGLDLAMVRIAAVAVSLVAELVVLAVVGWQGGVYLDHRWGSDPWFGLVGTALGVALGVGIAVKTVLAMQAADDA